jgi:putative acetyltransferase
MSGAVIVDASSPALLDAARRLFREYAASLSFSLEYQGFTEELASLPGRYAPPSGCLLLAEVDGDTVGCAGLREIGPGPDGRVCEMKRLYVRPSHRGLGLGQRLAREIVERGRALGYAAMRLDTGGDMLAARAIYEGMGFRPIACYNDDPHEDTLWFELRY